MLAHTPRTSQYTPPTMDIRPGEQYTISRKFFKLFGASFRILDPRGQVIGFCKQKAFKLKEDLRIYTDESKSTEMVSIRARNIIDFSATYDVALPSGQVIGSLRRKGLASTFIRDSWLVFNPAGKQIAYLEEESGLLGVLRRFVDFIAFLSPQKFVLRSDEGREIARFRTHFNIFLYRLSVTIVADDDELDDLMVLVIGCLIASIEGRQNSS
jgi:uncharacterized protein YxjI